MEKLCDNLPHVGFKWDQKSFLSARSTSTVLLTYKQHAIAHPGLFFFFFQLLNYWLLAQGTKQALNKSKLN